MKPGLFVAIVALGAACSSPKSPAVAATPACPPAVPTDQPARFATIFVDGKVVASNLEARREQEFPETYELVNPEPPAVAAIPAGTIDLIQFLRGPDAERDYDLCPGVVAFVISTKKPS